MKYSQFLCSTGTTTTLALLIGTGVVTTTGAQEPPPGCLCTMAQCCDNGTAYDCSVLETHVGATSQRDLVDFCVPYLNGTMNASTGVCDAILADPEFQRRFLSDGSLPESSLMSETIVGASCSDLVSNGCPIKMENTSVSVLTSWQALREGSCGSSSVELVSTNTTNITIRTSSGCTDEEELDIFSGAVSPAADPPTCPENPNVPFTAETTMGTEQQRWTCYEYTTIVNDESTTIRNYYLNLGNFACMGPTGTLPTSAPVAAPSTDPDTSSAGNDSSLEAFSLLLLGLLMSLF